MRPVRDRGAIANRSADRNSFERSRRQIFHIESFHIEIFHIEIFHIESFHTALAGRKDRDLWSLPISKPTLS